MKVEMIMPDLSTANAMVKIANWLVKPGQAIQRGQPLMEVETDKALMQVEAYLDGTLSEIVAPAETEVEVGQVIGIIETQDEVIPDVKPATPAQPEPHNEANRPTPTPSVVAKPGSMFARNREKAGQEKPPQQ